MKTGYLNVAVKENRLGYGSSPIGLSSPVARHQPWGLRFTVIGLALALLGSRIGLPFGQMQVSIVGPAVIAFAVWGFLRGHLLFHKTRLGLFVLLCSLTLISSAFNLVQPQLFGFSLSWLSVAQFLGLTSLMTLRFAQPVEEKHFFAAVNSVLAVIAVAGLLQFFLQFIGLGLFSFRGIIPDKFLFEGGFNLQNPIGGLKYLKSNGFFLLEASMFSQFMALGLSMEILVGRRLHYIALMLAGLVVSLSGTGWLILVTFIIAVAFGLKGRGVVLAAITVSVLAMGMFALAFFAPDFYDSFAGRIGEFGSAGSSAHARFIAPIWALQEVLWRAPWALWAGIGAGGAERLSALTYYVHSPNTPMKLLEDYGLPVLVTYIALLSAGRKTRAQMILLLPCLVLILFTGSYSQVPPLLFPIVLILCTPALIAEPPPAWMSSRVQGRLRPEASGRPLAMRR